VRSLAVASQTARQIDPNSTPARLTQTQLAERLGVDYNTIRRYRDGLAKKTLERWSATRDPAGISWRYLPHESQDLENFYAPVEEGEQEQPGKQSQAA
jgi:transcriptional regulator with XRE-family HTH domain